MSDTVNRSLVLIGGKAAGGKTASLRTLKDPTGVVYLGCEAGKELPFAQAEGKKFRKLVVTNPYQVHSVFAEAEKDKAVHTIVIDTLTFLMDMFESTVVLRADDGRAAWSDYAQFYKKLMQEYVAATNKNVIMLAHITDVLDEVEGVMETLVKVKGQLMTQGIESYFCNVVTARKIAVTKLKDYANPHLIITPEEEVQGFKYVYQTKLTRETVNARIRGPLGLWSTEETFIDNDAQFLLDQLHNYYN